MMPLHSPILLIIFNRADLTERVFERIRAANPKKLFIAADGPRKDQPGEERLCAETRAITSLIDWDCEVQRLYHDQNLGCKLAVSTAITWFFQQVEEGIILEDDCLPSPSFFPYCSELLEVYRNEPQVAMISGFNLRSNPLSNDSITYFFSKYPHIWGWATWRRTWSNYDVDMKNWSGHRKSLCKIKNSFTRRYFAKKFDSVKAGKNDTWDYQLIHQCLSSAMLSITPMQNLIENIGFDERATHTYHCNLKAMPSTPETKSPTIIHPKSIRADESEDLWKETHLYGIPRNRWFSLAKSTRKRLEGLKQLLR